MCPPTCITVTLNSLLSICQASRLRYFAAPICDKVEMGHMAKISKNRKNRTTRPPKKKMAEVSRGLRTATKALLLILGSTSYRRGLELQSDCIFSDWGLSFAT